MIFRWNGVRSNSLSLASTDDDVAFGMVLLLSMVSDAAATLSSSAADQKSTVMALSFTSMLLSLRASGQRSSDQAEKPPAHVGKPRRGKCRDDQHSQAKLNVPLGLRLHGSLVIIATNAAIPASAR